MKAKTLLGGALALAMSAIGGAALAEYPEKPVNFVVPWPPGDLEDVLTRMIAEDFQAEYGSDAAFEALDCNTLASGDADVINTTLQLILPCLDDVKVLASITDERISLIPETPTVGEIDPALNVALWNGLFVRKEVPQDVRDKIIAVAEKTVQSERAQKLAQETGALVYWQNAEDAAARIAADSKTMARINGMLE